MSNDDKTPDFWELRNIAKNAWDEALGGPLNTGIPYKLIYDVPNDIAPKIEHYSRQTGIPHIVAANLLGSESGYNAKAVSPTGAAGLAQMVSGTLYERLYRDKDALPEEAKKLVEDNIVKYNGADPGDPYWYKYKIKNGGDENAIKALAHDEDIALSLGFKHMAFSIKEGTKIYMENLSGRTKWMRHNMDELIDTLRHQDHLSPEEATARIDSVSNKISPTRVRVLAMEDEMDRTFTATDLKVFYVCGPTGGAGLLEALADPVKREQRHRAADYAPKEVVESNPRLFFKDHPDNTIYKDVTEFYEHMEKLVGSAPIPDELVSKPEPTEAEIKTTEAETTWHPPLKPL